MAKKVWIALGTNLGNKEKNLENAIKALSVTVTVQSISSNYVTPPWGYIDQPEFLNMVLSGETELQPHELLFFLKETEKQLGRLENFQYGPRLIDMDILYFHKTIMESKELTIPHPQIQNRIFVLAPLCEIAPYHFHPILQKCNRELLAALPDSPFNWLHQPETPADLLKKLLMEPIALEKWKNLSYSHRMEYINWINEVKKPSTRANRISKTTQFISPE
ncbi:MAG: 2-amino-4-hydroxy-6-hydroxymethyldihydropteridine diphosphokinase [Chloroflexi bacterium HGW-Chloroflexi-10]|nr:MAG: 2-amino-4-hydroxy-6-hydroxymethyldihydropteridine diphosphokinase [Chloroflexi bacterium HGW-Chloroflexi-10]